MQIYEEITPAEYEAAQPVHRSRPGGGSVLLVQAAVCLVLLLTVLILKFGFPAQYTGLRTWLEAELQRTVWIDHAPV